MLIVGLTIDSRYYPNKYITPCRKLEISKLTTYRNGKHYIIKNIKGKHFSICGGVDIMYAGDESTPFYHSSYYIVESKCEQCVYFNSSINKHYEALLQARKEVWKTNRMP